MIGKKRSIGRAGTVALILAMFMMVLPISRTPIALAYVNNLAFSDQLFQTHLVEGVRWPDPSTDGQVAVFDDVGYTYGTGAPNAGANCPNIDRIQSTINWGDGTSDNGSVYLLGGDAANNDACQYEVKGHHTYAEEGYYYPTVSAGDTQDGTAKSVSSNGLSVADAPLVDDSPSSLNSQTVTEGATNNNTLLAVFSDVDPGCDRNDYALKVDWGDGSVDTNQGNNVQIEPDVAGNCTFDVVGSHTYIEETAPGSPHNVGIQITDHNSQLSLTDQFAVTDAALSSIGQSVLHGVEGAPLGTQLLATFHDADPGCQAYDYHISINWGDGTAADTNYTLSQNTRAGGPCNFDVTGSHTYADENPGGVPYVGTVTINDAGASVAINFQSDIKDAPLSTVYTGTFPGFVEGLATPADGNCGGNTSAAYPTCIGQFHDANADCATVEGTTPSPLGTYYEFGITVNWGDGHTDSSSPGTMPSNVRIIPDATNACDFDVVATHIYAEENFGGYSFSAVVTDRGGSVTNFAYNIPVADAPLSDYADPNISGVEGIELNQPSQPHSGVIVGKFTDADPGCVNTDYAGTIDWGDGHVDNVAGLSPTPTPDDFFDIVPSTTAGDRPCTFDVIGTHVYNEEGNYKIVVTIHDSSKTIVTLGASATINSMIIDAPLNPISAPASVTETEGTPFGVFNGTAGQVSGGTANPRLYLGNFQDTAFTTAPPNAGSTSCDIKDYTATIDWGDSSTAGLDANSPGNPTTETSTTGGIVAEPLNSGHTNICYFDVLGSYDYHEAGDYTIKITVKDAGGAAPISWTVPIVVKDAQISTELTNQNFNPVEGQPTVSLLQGQPGGLQYLGTIHDPDVYCNAADYTVNVNWGDGQSDTYAPGAKYTGPGSDPGGSPYVIPALPGHKVTTCDFDIFGRHVYQEESAPGSPYNVVVTVTDDLAGPDYAVNPTTINDQATVSDAPLSDVSNGPTLGHDNNITRYEGIAFNTATSNDAAGNYHVPLATFTDTDPTAGCAPSDYSIVSINWGDGVTNTSGTIDAVNPNDGPNPPPSAPCTFDVNGSHTYAEESEPGVPYQITVVIKDNGSGTNSATLTFHPTATILDAPLTALNGYTYSSIDSTYPYQSIAGQNGSVTGTGPNNQTSACWLLTPCTRLIATFTDTAQSPIGSTPACVNEGETLQQHYTFSVDWGDGSTTDTTTAFAQPAVGGAACTYNVYATHTYTTPNSSGFTVSTTITDEGDATVTTSGAAASHLVVGVPQASAPVTNPRHFNVGFAYPPGSAAPTYVLSETLYHYKTLPGYTGHIQFVDRYHYQNNNGLYIPVQSSLTGRPTANCVITTSYSSQCNLAPLSDECTTYSTTYKTGVWWAEYQYKVNGTLYVRYVKSDLVQEGQGGVNDAFTITMSSPSNPANAVTSTPPIVPKNAVSISC